MRERETETERQTERDRQRERQRQRQEGGGLERKKQFQEKKTQQQQQKNENEKLSKEIRKYLTNADRNFQRRKNFIFSRQRRKERIIVWTCEGFELGSLD